VSCTRRRRPSTSPGPSSASGNGVTRVAWSTSARTPPDCWSRTLKTGVSTRSFAGSGSPASAKGSTNVADSSPSRSPASAWLMSTGARSRVSAPHARLRLTRCARRAAGLPRRGRVGWLCDLVALRR
jgi:hypothetical protein